MRVRAFELRLIAACSTVLWTVTAGLVLIGYRPGGPIDLLVGFTAILPVAIALVGLAWPPAAKLDRAFVLTVWLGLLTALLLVPSIGGIVLQLTSAGTQTILPSWQAAYPWLLALAGTSLFSGLGAARRLTGSAASRRRRLALGIVFGSLMTLTSGVLFGGAAIANELALHDRPVTFSRFGPTDAAVIPPACDGLVLVPTTAHVEISLTEDVDTHPVGWANIVGTRSGTNVRWTADVAAASTLGRVGVVRARTGGWRLSPGRGWTPVDPATLDTETLDLRATELVLTAGNRTAVEDRGLEFIEGARARHCRISIDGPAALLAIPQMVWFVGTADLHRWRGELDFWIFADGEVGQVTLAVNGDAAETGVTGLQATIRTLMIVVDRDLPVSIVPPVT
jgi:hypothetical protein